MGEGDKYDKAEAFAHDATMLAVSLIFLWGTVSLVKNCTALFKSASLNLFGRSSGVTASELTQTYKGAKLIYSFDDFAEYAKEVLGNDGDDTAKLKKVAQLVEDGSKKIGKKLSKEELKAGLDALWGDGGVEGALTAMERVAKLDSMPREKKLALSVDEYLDDFAKQRNAHTWKDFPADKYWRQGVMDAIADPDTEILFNLDRINNPWSAVTEGRVYGERARATSWELYQIYRNKNMWDRVTWYRNGSIVPNPLE